VVVLDVLMPGLNGLELLARLREDPSARTCRPSSSAAGCRSPTSPRAAHGATYLTKPVVISALLAAIDAALLVDQPLAGSW
jgi:CheY-like chemotaxis protein